MERTAPCVGVIVRVGVEVRVDKVNIYHPCHIVATFTFFCFLPTHRFVY